jgi:glucose/arabinose dehydrogenase
VPRLWIIVCGLAIISCGSSTPSPPSVDTPGAVETIHGTERLGWDQPASDAVELATFGYAVYVDGARTEATGVVCESAPGPPGFPCSANLPPMSLGAHTLELTAFINSDAGLLESPRSAPVHVNVVAQTAAIGNASPSGRAQPSSVDNSTAGSAAKAPALREGLSARATAVDGLMSPTDMAVTPDGRLLVAERSGQIRVVRDGRLLDEPAVTLADTIGPEGQLLAIALDPEFDRNGFVYTIYTAPDRFGAPAFTLARFREVGDTLGDRAVLLDAAPASSSLPSAALRFGPDGKLYAAYDDGGDTRGSSDPTSMNGKILRLNTDGTTPVDARGATPVYMGTFGSPVAIDWDPPSSTLWVADRAAGAVPFVFYRGAMFPEWSGRLVTASTLFQDPAAAGVSRVAVGPDGALYYLTARGAGRVASDRTP